ncbi:hypothetical protein PTNB73_06730 [Pyrenophora teres f. teres]|uniref:Uncharacterized protein n=1 Tax=Pyrenophora teres f. teres TaxID=97479 RepID=A0A6S6W5V8_9PLEO|nr:hypothetical protein HRS9139_07491 [Pyrenophora teres f. teres]KAE8829307.1 hypothetical protein HRS9122_09122 [Pyrenophora teres f. teres]KAE8830872.1 hypothetical protein PTNB85_07459 [Pyrenophora teres f. teres]KAE8857130.1 hypothetical protein PTNB29_08197 [Pyrenophora teres f. teres]KAE8863523.1 hypothetical protein PTNB73_06730 [Pyrenophora teres f. teres]
MSGKTPYQELWAYPLRLFHSFRKNSADLTSNPEQSAPTDKEKWYYPVEIANDLEHADFPQRVKEEVYACAWEYTRCVIPQYTNWKRYVAFMRIIIIGIIAEYNGDLIKVAETDILLGYNLTAVLADLFQGTQIHTEMAREFRCFLLVTADKSSSRRDGLLFRSYVNALAKSPSQWFRMRDTDALIRFTLGAALACNDLDGVWYTEKQMETLCELGATLYDSVAFFKHRAEAETNSTFAYVPSSVRVEAFHQCRELLWALDVAWAGKPEHLIVINFLRFFGGPIHMMMRRYRFVEEGLTIGRPETETVVKQARQHLKLWNRVDAEKCNFRDFERYKDLTARSNELMFSGLRDFLDASSEESCEDCQQRQTYGAENSYAFGGVQLCSKCKELWGAYVRSFPDRLNSVFPEAQRSGGSDCQIK